MLKEANVEWNLEKMARAYGSGLIESLSGQHCAAGYESIATGRSGSLLVLIELFRQSPDPDLADIIDNAIYGLVDYCKKTPTHDYSLYAGRAGFIYVLIQWYYLTGRSQLLTDSLKIMDKCAQEFLYSEYTSDYLFDGRSGTILILLQLYLLTKEARLLETISLFLQEVLGHVCFGVDGAFWTRKDEVYIRPSCGFAHGSSGIRFVLDRLNRYCRNPVINSIVGETDRYLQSCWIGEFQTWGDFSVILSGEESDRQYKERFSRGDESLFLPRVTWGWANGAAGILFSGLASRGISTWEKANAAMCRNLSGGKPSSLRLYDGLSGTGLYLLHSGDVQGEPLIREIISIIEGGLSSHVYADAQQDSFLYGRAGQIYFLLKSAAGGTPDENILIPFLGGKPAAEVESVGIPFDGARIRSRWLRRQFTRTVCLAEALTPEAWKNYIQAPMDDHLAAATGPDTFLGNDAFAGLPADKQACLLDVYSLEKKIADIALGEKRSPFRIYLDEWEYRTAMLEQLNGTTEWLLRQRLAVSDKISIFHSRWNWSYKDDFGTMEVLPAERAKAKADRFEYVIQPIGEGKWAEFVLKMDALLLFHLFQTEKVVEAALEEVKQYVKSIPESVLRELLLTMSRSSNTKDFIDQLDNICLFKIRQWIFRGILVMK